VNRPADTLIVGGGTSGCVLAARLSADPARSVLLLEEGPDHTGYDATVTSPGQAQLVSRRREFAEGLRLDVADRAVPLARGRVLGGTSAVNYLATVRGLPADYDRWAARGLAGWAWADVLPYFRRAETDRDFPGSPVHGDAGPLTVSRWPRRTFAVGHRAFHDGLAEVGVPTVADLNDPAQLPGVGVFPASVRESGERLTVSGAYLTGEVRARPNLRVRTGVRVARLLVADGRVTGVETTGGERITAGEVVVSCGAVGSPALLLRSGLGPAGDLRALGLPVAADLPGVGRGLQDHLGPALTYRADPGTRAEGPPGGPAQTVWVARGSDGAGDPDVHVFPVPLPGEDGSSDPGAFAVLVFSMRPEGRGRVTLRPDRPEGKPLVSLPPPGEREVAATRAVFGVLDAWERSSVCSGLGLRRTSGPASLSTPEAAAQVTREALVSYAHLAGSCAMGPDSDPDAVLDAACRVRGATGLRVVDASAMPEIPVGNTYLSCVMMAERVADLMR
jgi:choline dehydrogenase